ncbi:divergent PAP2 family protein [Treponema pedis]|nr:divergent PAP2 family protein [Treponema pedis]
MQKEQLIMLFSSPIFLAAVTSWLLSQFIKTIFAMFNSSIRSPLDFFELILWRTGGMPSSHSALVASLTVSIGIRHGFDSDLFIFAIFVAMIVIRDAVGVRRSSGLQARALNDLGAKFSEINSSYSFKPVREIQGHKPVEAVAGIILGTITAILFAYFG